jgi:hypothetical protein
MKKTKEEEEEKMLTEKFHTQRTDRKTLGELGLFYVYYLCRCNGFPVVARLACWNIYLSLLLLYARSCNRRRVCVVFCSVIFRSSQSPHADRCRPTTSF